ncbi:MAG: hypothetical protein WA733_10430 [Methylocystis sp.]
MLRRPFFVGLAATLIFFVIFGLVRGCTFLLILFINIYITKVSGITAWILPIFASGMAAAISATVAIVAINKIFEDIPRRSVAITIFSFWAIGGLLTFAGALIGLLVFHDYGWSDVRGDLTYITGAIVSCVIVRNELWPGRKNSS